VNRCRSWVVVLFLLFLMRAPAVRGQAFATATAPGVLQIGGSASFARSNQLPTDSSGNPSSVSELSSQIRSNGFGLYANFNFNDHWSLAFDMDRLNSTGDSSSQAALEGGLRYMLFHRARFTPYARASFGRGIYDYADNAGSIGYNVYGLAGGTDFRLSHSFNLRAEYEHQSWLGVPIRNPSPQIVKVGIAYRFHTDLIGDRLRK
jgi:hypothetical protein